MTCARSSSAHRSSGIPRTARNGADSRHSGICPGGSWDAATARCSSGTVDRDRPDLSSVQAERRPFLSEPTRGGLPYSPHPRDEETGRVIAVGHRQQGLDMLGWIWDCCSWLRSSSAKWGSDRGTVRSVARSLRGDRARGIDQHAARTERLGACCEDRHLDLRQLLDVLGGDAPAQVGASLERAQTRAWRIDENAIENRPLGARQRGVRQLDANTVGVQAPRGVDAARRHRARLRSTASTSPSSPISAAICVLLPPGAAHRSSTRSPG